MEFNDFVMRAAVDEYLRRRAVADYEELLKREINAQVDECESPFPVCQDTTLLNPDRRPNSC